MKQIQEALEELKTTVKSMAVCHALIDSFVLFLFCLLFSLLFNIPLYYSIIPFFAYAIIHTNSVVKSTRYEYIEKKVPFLKEQLRTVADNMAQDNDVINALNQEVLKKMKDIRNSVFLKFGKITSRITTMVILSFLIIFFSATNIHFLNLPKAVQNIAKLPLGRDQFQINETMLSFNETDEGYGNKSIAELGYQELQINIAPMQSDLDLSKIKDPEKKDFKSEYAPKEIKATSDISYEENIPKNYHKIVKNYFSSIAKE